LRVLVDGKGWSNEAKHPTGYFQVISLKERGEIAAEQVCFCETAPEQLIEHIGNLHAHDVLVLTSVYDNSVQWMRWAFMQLKHANKKNPVIFKLSMETDNEETFQLEAGVKAGSLFVDGLGDGIWIDAPNQPKTVVNSTSFGVLQATRLRTSKTEYISCPSCGRTLFDLQETTANIRSRTSHLKGLKNGIMGCIVNGPGEMAYADYGYVGSGPGKITLYKEKEVVRKNVNTAEAVDALIDLIKEHGDWVEPVLESL